ncbi:hypothetical protein C8A05DRAFT_40397 [Staphylotrichum tortipilum]|uniref:N-acetyltransferase domain-containing protein n=1 Tax=Staphylotrichum tortipilum TaxID=2831512 RepID=A0AAN6MTT8_9PEZI|nr:hypothetical protein C8A05DRAFT_40397 [Staphylotrichum longicolle]
MAADDPVPSLREASRKLVREWGFLQPTLNHFPLSPAAVHCLIEIGDYGRRAFPDLCAELNVTPTRLAYTLDELASCGAMTRNPPAANPDGFSDADRGETYSLTPAGETTLREINAYAQAQVTTALAAAPPGAGANITAAFEAYAAALERSRPNWAVPTPDITPAATPEPPTPATVDIVAGYRPGILARTLEMHMDYYHPRYDWGREFEAELSSDLSGLLRRLDRPCNEVWSAVLKTPARSPQEHHVEKMVGMVYIDGECGAGEGVARLRAFIVDESTRGLGVGKRLLGAAMDFVKEMGFRECKLTTLESLTVARKLYEREGFRRHSQGWFEGFGKTIMEITYLWRREEGI